uniref:EF-hand domain-containing protein n=1 Tax=Eutreptiella gymnastica TaxID=73025 RepID=A0A7S1N7E9_9EUGL|mmetsp:Transcript_132143/g.229089  ORF Transcript_132143/g.229089 Transcript_132143/m.229089 type:complete len:525 (+) Transcript_132143:75-1649(+)
MRDDQKKAYATFVVYDAFPVLHNMSRSTATGVSHTFDDSLGLRADPGHEYASEFGDETGPPQTPSDPATPSVAMDGAPSTGIPSHAPPDATFERTEVAAHELVQFEFEAGTQWRPVDLVLDVSVDPPDAEVSLCFGDRRPQSTFDYRWVELVKGNTANVMQFGEIHGTRYVALSAPIPVNSLAVTARYSTQVAVKDDLLLPWKVAEAYCHSKEEEDMVREWLGRNSSCYPMLDEEGCTPLIRACKCPKRGSLRMLELLCTEFSRFFMINQQDKSGRTALHHLMDVGDLLISKSGKVVYERTYALAQYLLSNPAVEVGLQDNEGNTPLHVAAQADLPSPVPGQGSKLLKLLLQARDNEGIGVRNDAGHTPLEAAEAMSCTHNVNVLMAAIVARNEAAGLSVSGTHISGLGRKSKGPLLEAAAEAAPRPKRQVPAASLQPWQEDNVGGLLLSEAQLRQAFISIDGKGEGWISKQSLVDWVRANDYGVNVKDPADTLLPAMRRYCTLDPERLAFEEFAVVVLSLGQG